MARGLLKARSTWSRTNSGKLANRRSAVDEEVLCKLGVAGVGDHVGAADKQAEPKLMIHMPWLSGDAAGMEPS